MFILPRDSRQRGAGRCRRKAYSLVELLLVISVLAIAMGLVTMSMGSLRSTSLTTATRQFADYVNLCRSQAIARHTAIRIGIVEDSQNPDDRFRRYSAWAWDKRTREFVQIHEWKRLSLDLVFAPRLPEAVKESNYALRDASAVRGDYWLGRGKTQVAESGERVRFIEFSPAGRASIEDGDLRNLLIVMRPGDAEATTMPVNWAQFNIDTLTGRVRIHRP